MSHKTYVPTLTELGGFFILAVIVVGLLILGVSALNESPNVGGPA